MRIGFIGLGIMGESMCENIIIKSAAEVYVYDVNKNQVDKLVGLGGIASGSSKEVGEKCDVIITMVPKSEHVRTVYEELLPVLSEGKITIDMSTIEPSVSIQLSERVRQTGAVMLDAPVVKSKPAAIKGELGIYIGGEEVAFEKVKHILGYMGSNIIRMGDNGAGLYMKICHNALVAQIQNGVNEMLLFGLKNNLNFDDIITAISYGGAQNFYLDTKKNAIKNKDFTTAFSVENMYKDVNIAASIQKELGLTLPGLENIKRVYDKAMETSLDKEDFSATYKVVDGMQS